MEKTAVFIDGAYLDNVLYYEHGGVKVNYRILVETMVGADTLLRTYYYHCPPYQGRPPTIRQRQKTRSWGHFKYALKKIPRFEVREGVVVCRGTNPDGSLILQQKRVDLMLGVDMALLAGKQQISRVILLSGDSDFVPAIEAVKSEGVITTLWHGRRFTSVSRELFQVCDERFELTSDIVQSARRQPKHPAGIS